MLSGTILFAFGLTILAGLSTGIGSLLALVTKKTSPRFLSVALGFSAGFMIYVSLIELFADAKKSLISLLGAVQGNWVTIAAFFAGILLIAVVDRLVPSIENPHEARRIENMNDPSCILSSHRQKLMRIGFMSAVAIAIHNFPEGLATFASALHNPSLGVAIAFAVAIHNIPEGIAVSVPIYCATGSRGKAFRWSFLSGLCEPLGALIGYAIFFSFINDLTLGILYAMIAGIMVFVSLDELLPSAREYGSPHLAIYGLIGGMAIMAASLILFMS
jgi:zinc transporter, ZIP family